MESKFDTVPLGRVRPREGRARHNSPATDVLINSSEEKRRNNVTETAARSVPIDGVSRRPE